MKTGFITITVSTSDDELLKKFIAVFRDFVETAESLSNVIKPGSVRVTFACVEARQV